jgi:hypothetical protein
MKKVIFILLINLMCLQFSFGQCWDRYDIQTPKGSPVVTMLCTEYSPAERAILDNDFMSYYCDEYEDGVLYADTIQTYDGYSSSGMFNCHGYAWLRVEQGIDRWINAPSAYNSNFGAYMNDGSYIEVPYETFPAKIFWTSDDHSGITTPDAGWVISKWANGPLYRHRWNYGKYGMPDSPPTLKYYVRNCDNTGTLIINLEYQTITTNQTHTACSINVKDVKVSNNSKLILDAENEFNIIGEFEVGVGSELEIW